MAIGSEFSIDYSNKLIDHVSGQTGIYSVNALYSWLQDTFDEQTAMDDKEPMSAQTPTEYTMINGWYLSESCLPYLYGGAIQTSGYLNDVHCLELKASGYTNCVSTDIGKQVKDDTVEIGVLLYYDNTRRKWWVRRGSATVIAADSDILITSGTGAGTALRDSRTGENLFANIYTLGSIMTSPKALLYIFQNQDRFSEWWTRRTFLNFSSPEHIDVLVKVKECGTEIDQAKITVLDRQYGDAFDHYEIDLTTGGRNAIPLSASADLNNTTGELYLTPTAITNFDVGNFVRGNTSGATGRLMSTASSRFYLGNVIGTFQTSETLSETTDGTAAGDTGTTTTNNGSTAYTDVVAGYGSSIKLYHVSGKLVFDAGQTAAPALYATVTGGTSSATGIVLEVTTSGGTWGGNNATGNVVLGNVSGTFGDNEIVTYSGGQFAVNSTHGLDCTVTTVDRNFSLQSSYPYSTIIDCNTMSVSQLYEYVKYCAREGQSAIQFRPYASKIRMLKFGGTYVNCVDSDVGKPVVGTTTTDSGLLLAYNNSTKVWTVLMDACTGTAASDDLFDQAEAITITGGTGSGTTLGASAPGLVDGQEYIRSIPSYSLTKASPFGTFAGGVFFGAQGVWIEDMATADANKYSLIDHNGTTRTPPAQIEVKITGVVSGDRCALFLATGDNTIVEKAQYNIQTSHSGVAYIRVEENIPNDTPTTGYIRVARRDAEGGLIVGEDRYAYTGFSNANQPTYSEFTLSGSITNDLDTYDTAYVPWIDEEATGTSVSKSVQYVADRYVVARVRKKGILPFEQKTQILSSGCSPAAIRNTDSIVT